MNVGKKGVKRGSLVLECNGRDVENFGALQEVLCRGMR